MPFKADYSIAIATPVWGPGNLLFVSAEYNAGAKVVELQRNGLQTKATELWSSNRLRLHHGNAMRIGDAIYFSSGGKGSQAILSAVDARSGNILWQERSIQKATFVWADGKLFTLAQDGTLDDRASVAEGLPDRGEGAAPHRAVVDAAGDRRHACLSSRSPLDDGGRPRMTPGAGLRFRYSTDAITIRSVR